MILKHVVYSDTKIYVHKSFRYINSRLEKQKLFQINIPYKSMEYILILYICSIYIYNACKIGIFSYTITYTIYKIAHNTPTGMAGLEPRYIFWIKDSAFSHSIESHHPPISNRNTIYRITMSYFEEWYDAHYVLRFWVWCLEGWRFWDFDSFSLPWVNIKHPTRNWISQSEIKSVLFRDHLDN